MKKFLQFIFSVKNVDKHKQLMVLGIKFKLKRKQFTQLPPPAANLTQQQQPAQINQFLSYDYLRKTSFQNRQIETFSPTSQALISYQILNKMKEIQLKNKLKEGKKIRVGFLLDTIAKFSCPNVYKIMEKSDIFEPFILLYSGCEFKLNNDTQWNELIDSKQKLLNNGYKVHFGYNEEREYIPIETYKPDIIFTNIFYLDIYQIMSVNSFSINLNYLVCYLNYAINTVNFYDYHYNNRAVNTGWKYFCENKEDYNEILRYSKYYGTNIVLSGFPKLDIYAKPYDQCAINPKIDNGKPIVIYAPHWTVGNIMPDEYSRMSTFHIYYDYFLELVKKHPDINFVFKPHPSLQNALADQGIMTNEEYQQYIKEWEDQPNGLYVFDGEYIDLFRKSSLMITDSGSFIAEYLPSENPCLYLINPNKNPNTVMEGYSLLGRKILEKYYLAYNKEEIEKYFNMLILDKNDPLKQERKNIEKGLFTNIGCAGQTIVDYLTDILTD